MVADYKSLTMEQQHFVDGLVNDYNMTETEALQWIVDNGFELPEMIKG